MFDWSATCNTHATAAAGGRKGRATVGCVRTTVRPHTAAVCGAGTKTRMRRNTCSIWCLFLRPERRVFIKIVVAWRRQGGTTLWFKNITPSLAFRGEAWLCLYLYLYTRHKCYKQYSKTVLPQGNLSLAPTLCDVVYLFSLACEMVLRTSPKSYITIQ